MGNIPSRTSLAVWSENPNGLSTALREPLEQFIVEVVGDIDVILRLPVSGTLIREGKQSEGFQDIRDIPTGEEIFAWKKEVEISLEEKKRVENFLKRNGVKIHEVLQKHKKAA